MKKTCYALAASAFLLGACASLSLTPVHGPTQSHRRLVPTVERAPGLRLGCVSCRVLRDRHWRVPHDCTSIDGG